MSIGRPSEAEWTEAEQIWLTSEAAREAEREDWEAAYAVAYTVKAWEAIRVLRPRHGYVEDRLFVAREALEAAKVVLAMARTTT